MPVSSDEWKEEVVATSVATCPECGSLDLSMGACGIGAMTVHQEYTCNACQFQFKAIYALVGYFQG